MIVLKEDDGNILNAFDTMQEFRIYIHKFIIDFNKDMVASGEEPTNYEGVNEFQICRDFSLKVEFY